MRRFTCLVLLALIAFASCKKSNNDHGCISNYTETFNISAANLKTADSLCLVNSIATQNFKVTNVVMNEDVIGGQINRYAYVYVRYYANGLPIFYSDEVFSFKNGSLQSRTGSDFGAVDLGTTPSLRLNDLRNLFVATYNTDYNNANVHAADSCLRAEPGYYNITAQVNGPTPNVQPTHDVVKAWKVQFQNQQFPIAYFRDDNSALIIMDGGLLPNYYNSTNPKRK